MYELRRTYKTVPGKERLVASILQRMGELVVEAGKRSPFTIAFNGGTCPGEKQLVHMTWTAESLESPLKASGEHPPGYDELIKKRDVHTIDTWIEFRELMTPEKLIDS